MTGTHGRSVDAPASAALVAASEPFAPVHEMVSDRAGRRPEAAAVDGLSYRELDDRAEQLARTLLGHGVAPGTPVAVRLPPGALHIATLLAIMKAGCYFVPLGLADPVERQIEVLRQTLPAGLVVERPTDAEDLARGYRHDLEGREPLVIAAGDLARRVAESHRAPLPRVAPDTPVYVVHTSGSTGRPKAIMQSHSALAQFVGWMGVEFRMGPERRAAQWASPNYDASICEIFATLVAGGTVCPVPDAIRLDVDRLVDWLVQRRVDVLQIVPSFGRELLHAIQSRADAPHRPSLDHLLLAGEPLTGELAAGLVAALPGLRLINLYGATETILATWMEVDAVWPGAVPIGRAIPGREVLVLDAADRRCPAGVTGEIVVRSPYLTLGYVGQERAGGSFAAIAVAGDGPAAARIPCYRTGDLGRWRGDGLLEFRGRRDRQVKVRGVRVELTEIEAVLASHESVVDCVVVPADNDGGPVESLIAYVVPAAGSGSPATWRAHLRRRFSQQVVPSAFVTVPALPRNAGGKVDRSRLPAVSAELAATQPAGARRLGDFRTWAAGLAAEPSRSGESTANSNPAPPPGTGARHA